jgi:hypothetical protein
MCHGVQEYYIGCRTVGLLQTNDLCLVYALFYQLQLLKEQYLLDMNELYDILSTVWKQVCTYHLDKVFAVCILLRNVQSVAHCVVACIVPAVVLISAS